MRDPYEVLGIPRSATDDEIKKAYRALSKKYHPDLNQGNPVAEEKFKEVQEAYDRIMKKDTTSQGGYGYGGYGYGGGNANTDNRYAAAESYIRSGYYQQAYHILEGMTDRTAHWYYLSAIVALRMGNNITAKDYIGKAVSMEPNNFMYRRLYDQLHEGAGWYQSQGETYGRTFTMGNDYCFKLCLINLLCNMCCGGRFLCC